MNAKFMNEISMQESALKGKIDGFMYHDEKILLKIQDLLKTSLIERV